MSAEDSEGLSSAARGLLELEKHRPGPDPVDEQRVLERLVAAKAFAGAAVGGAAGTATATALKVAVAAVVGALAGGGLVQLKASGELDQVRAELAQARAERVVVTLPPAAEPAPREPIEVVATPPALKSAPRAPATRVGSMSEEVALIEQGRTALLKNDLDGAAAALSHHEVAFPKGHMAEEREMMMIQVMLGQGREADAHAAGERFRQRYPKSQLLSTIDTLLGAPK